jgi:hypothetical protein
VSPSYRLRVANEALMGHCFSEYLYSAAIHVGALVTISLSHRVGEIIWTG